MRVLSKAAGNKTIPEGGQGLVQMLRKLPPAEQLLRFMVSDDYFDLRKELGLAAR